MESVPCHLAGDFATGSHSGTSRQCGLPASTNGPSGLAMQKSETVFPLASDSSPLAPPHEAVARHLQMQLHHLPGEFPVPGGDGQRQVPVMGQALLHVGPLVELE